MSNNLALIVTIALVGSFYGLVVLAVVRSRRSSRRRGKWL